MSNPITFNKDFTLDPFNIVLSTRSKVLLGQISNIDSKSIVYKTNMNSADELTFTVYKYIDDREERLWDEIRNLKLVYVKELDEYFEIRFDLEDANALTKNITAVSLCEAELSQIMLYNIEINSELDIAREDYVVTKFYDPDNPKASLLNRILDKAPHYKIGHVDASIASMQRTFSIDGQSIYDFMVGECAEQFDCLFKFDTTTRTISVYDLLTVCMNDECSYYTANKRRYRGEFNDICPKCGSRHIYYYGKDTTVYVDSQNLTDNINFTTDVDSIKNTFRLQAGDDDMTAAVINNNPNGSAYIYSFSEDTTHDMSEELVERINTYNELYDSYQEEYTELSKDIYESLDQLMYLRSTMMPTHVNEPTDASKEAAKLTAENLSPLGMLYVRDYTETESVDIAIRQYAKVFIHSGKYKVEVNESNFIFNRTDPDTGISYGTWTGNFKVTNYVEKDDTAISNTIIVEVNDDYETFLFEKVQKQIAKDNAKLDDNSIFDVLNITDLDKYKEALTYYCLNRLSSFYDSLQSCLEILVRVDQATKGTEYYDIIYQPYYTKSVYCQEEIDRRQKSINEETEHYEELANRRTDIQKILNFREYLGEDLYNEFCSYRREDTYTNDNYISTGLDNVSIFEKANTFLDVAKRELYKASTPQNTINTNLYNLLAMKEFQPIVDYFEIGNFIRIKVNNVIYRLRLIEYQISFDKFDRLETVFSNLTITADGVNDIRSILSSAQQMATSYGSVSRQAEEGYKASETIDEFNDGGINSSVYKIVNDLDAEISLSNHGILCRSYEDSTEEYSSEQLKITSNVIAFTNDNWNSVKLGLGKISYEVDGISYEKYGINADTAIASTIIGGDIYSTNYSSSSSLGTHINLNTGGFSLAGGKILFDPDEDLLVLDGVKIYWNDIIDAEENVTELINEEISESVPSLINSAINSKVPTIINNTVDKEYVEDLSINMSSLTLDIIRKGSIELSDIESSAIYEETISFSSAMSNVPQVFVNAVSEADSTPCSMWVKDETVNGFTVCIEISDNVLSSTDLIINWFAIC